MAGRLLEIKIQHCRPMLLVIQQCCVIGLHGINNTETSARVKCEYTCIIRVDVSC
jgi:hypothetical protein